MLRVVVTKGELHSYLQSKVRGLEDALDLHQSDRTYGRMKPLGDPDRCGCERKTCRSLGRASRYLLCIRDTVYCLAERSAGLDPTANTRVLIIPQEGLLCRRKGPPPQVCLPDVSHGDLFSIHKTYGFFSTDSF